MGAQTVVRGQARDAIVEAASALFNALGIRAVSADRVIEAVGCSKVTFYRHFRSKDDLVVAYLEGELARLQRAAAEYAGASPTIDEIATALIDEMCQPGFRGCPFINAAAEYPDPDHPVRAVVMDFRRWMTGAIEAWLEQRSVDAPAAVATQVMMLRDGALVEGYVSGDSASVHVSLARGLGRLIGER